MKRRSESSTFEMIYVCGCNKQGQLGVTRYPEYVYTADSMIQHKQPMSMTQRHEVGTTTTAKVYDLMQDDDEDDDPPKDMVKNIFGSLHRYRHRKRHENPLIAHSKPLQAKAPNHMEKGPPLQVKNPVEILQSSITTLPQNERWRSIAAGYYHTLFLSASSGNIYVAGEDDRGQLGIAQKHHTNTPKRYVREFTKIPNGKIRDIGEVKAGHSFSFLISRDRKKIYGMGNNASGQLGLGNEILEVASPHLVTGLKIESHEYIKDVSCGGNHSIVLVGNRKQTPRRNVYKQRTRKSLEKIYIFGNNRYGQLGLGHTMSMTTPSLLPRQGVDGIKHITCGFFFSVIVTDNHHIFSTGENTYGSCGIGNTTTQSCTKFTQVHLPALIQNYIIADISAGDDHCVFISVDPHNTQRQFIVAFGRNKYGQCGLGHFRDVYSPTILDHPSLQGKTFEKVVCRGNFTILLTTEQEIYSFGANKYGQTGHTIRNCINVPQLVDFQWGQTQQILNICAGFGHVIYHTAQTPISNVTVNDNNIKIKTLHESCYCQSADVSIPHIYEFYQQHGRMPPMDKSEIFPIANMLEIIHAYRLVEEQDEIFQILLVDTLIKHINADTVHEVLKHIYAMSSNHIVYSMRDIYFHALSIINEVREKNEDMPLFKKIKNYESIPQRMLVDCIHIPEMCVKIEYSLKVHSPSTPLTTNDVQRHFEQRADLCIEFKDHEPIYCHSYVIHKACPKLLNFLQFTKLNNNHVIEALEFNGLTNMDPKLLKVFVDYLYTGYVTVHRYNASPLLQLWSFFDMPMHRQLVDACQTILAKTLTVKNIVKHIKLFHENQIFEILHKEMLQFCAQHRGKILQFYPIDGLAKNLPFIYYSTILPTT